MKKIIVPTADYFMSSNSVEVTRFFWPPIGKGLSRISFTMDGKRKTLISANISILNLFSTIFCCTTIKEFAMMTYWYKFFAYLFEYEVVFISGNLFIANPELKAHTLNIWEREYKSCAELKRWSVYDLVIYISKRHHSIME